MESITLILIRIVSKTFSVAHKDQCIWRESENLVLQLMMALRWRVSVNERSECPSKSDMSLSQTRETELQAKLYREVHPFLRSSRIPPPESEHPLIAFEEQYRVDI
jgi:hypothetical protein